MNLHLVLYIDLRYTEWPKKVGIYQIIKNRIVILKPVNEVPFFAKLKYK